MYNDFRIMNFIFFILWFILAEFLVGSTRFLFRKKTKHVWLTLIIIVLEVLAAIILAFTVIATDAGTWFFGPLFFALYIALFMDAAAHLIFLFIRIFIKKGNRFAILTIISNLFAVSFLVFGMMNMQNVKVKYLSYSSTKLVYTYKISFVSDLHIGKAQTVETTINTLQRIKKENADFNIIGGDLVDEYTKADEFNKVVKELSTFAKPVYFIRGNHELTGALKLETVETKLSDAGVHVVVDEFVPLASDLTLLGRDDKDSKSRKKIDELINPTPASFLLVADHQPTTFKDNTKLNIDLQLSGHTHAGQLFPLRWCYSWATYSYGEYRYNGAVMHVSGGAAGWGVPFRTEISPEFEIVTIKPSI